MKSFNTSKMLKLAHSKHSINVGYYYLHRKKDMNRKVKKVYAGTKVEDWGRGKGK